MFRVWRPTAQGFCIRFSPLLVKYNKHAKVRSTIHAHDPKGSTWTLFWLPAPWNMKQIAGFFFHLRLREHNYYWLQNNQMCPLQCFEPVAEAVYECCTAYEIVCVPIRLRHLLKSDNDSMTKCIYMLHTELYFSLKSQTRQTVHTVQIRSIHFKVWLFR